MKKPLTPRPFYELITEVSHSKIPGIVGLRNTKHVTGDYLHWDRLRKGTPPDGFTSDEWWLAVKLERIGTLKPIPLTDKMGKPFQFCVPEPVLKALHQIDIGAGSGATNHSPEPITNPLRNPQTKDKYLIRSLMEEAITSSQLEGAPTTREIAKEMIRTGRKPQDRGERMIYNNYNTMERIMDLKNRPLSPEMVFDIQTSVTEGALDIPDGAGRFRRADERIVVESNGEIFHDPPPAGELLNRLRLMCDFANGISPEYFVHPVLRAIILHFWLAYDHPFVDGNGRTARALFYWSMLNNGYWLFQFVSISTILKKFQNKYALSFLYTETDENDLTYFILDQTQAIIKAIQQLHDYMDQKTSDLRELESQLRVLKCFNHRQVDIIRHALKHPYQQYTIESHKASHNVAYDTARTDLLGLHSRGLLEKEKRSYEMVFSVPNDLEERIKKLGNKLDSDQ